MTKTKKLYTTPKVCRCKNGEWFVFFRYWDSNAKKYKPFKRSEDLNRIKDRKVKEASFKALRDARETWLDAGWNPITNTFPSNNTIEEMDLLNLQQMTLVEALDYGFKQGKKGWSKKTIQDYSSMFKYIREAAIQILISSIQITDVKRLHYRKLIEATITNRDLGNKGYNKYRDFLSTLIGLVAKDDIIPTNLIKDIDLKPTIKTIAHRPPTPEERTLIIHKILNDHRDYYRFLSVEYGCGMRPKEICALKIKDLIVKEQVFRLIPEENSEDEHRNSKTNVERDIIIPNWLMDLLAEMKLHAYNPDWYIFSACKKFGTFNPGPKRLHSNTPTSWWYKIVKAKKTKGGLGLDVDQYGLKKLSGDDLVRLQRREGVDKLLDLPRERMGHTNDRMTEVYVYEHKAIINEVLKNKMPVL